MKVVVDRNLDLSAVRFPSQWVIVEIDGRSIGPADVVDADALLVRSVTKIDEKLLHGSAVGFIGTATSGLDHIDQDYLDNHGITLVGAPGSNANAVTDYVFSALAYSVLHVDPEITRKTIGVIGAGNVGGLLVRKLQQLGLDVLIYDPPLMQDLTEKGGTLPGHLNFSSLEDICKAHIVSLHVPLIKDGEFPTQRMIDENFLSAMHKDAMLINTCRGEVVDEPALLRHLEGNEEFVLISDVWWNEPRVNPELVYRSHVATPHIAGYSALAKLTAANQVANALLQNGIDESEKRSGLIDEDELSAVGTKIELNNRDAWRIVEENFSLLELTRKFRQSSESSDGQQAFDLMRRDLASRKEFRELPLTGMANDSITKLLQTIGFNIID